MDAERWQQVEQLCQCVLELEESSRAAYLETACAGDPALRREVESLLAQQRNAAEFIETPAFELAAQSLATDPVWNEHEDHLLGRRLGSYQIVERIGSGGMGEVYRAVRADEEYRTQVAIKMVRSGQDPATVNSRFKNERQILASLDHPNIARLLDGGTSEDGVPYVVMELIEGQRIDQYCEAQNLSTIDRLKLFRQVCSAVQYAHQRLIVHRDIKPANILVTAGGVPKLLDFGIAKILNAAPAPPEASSTLTILRMLTPGYASPEQIKGATITTASDVYSLGVVLYELLTGRSPYGGAGNKPNQIAQAVCDIEPERPSTVVLRADDDAKQPRQQQTIPGNTENAPDGSQEKLARRLRGDLDNIVLMALRKEPERRYASVEQFSEDLRRHVENLPVIARKDTIGYRAAKFLTRHKAGVAAAATVALTLITGLAVTLHEARVAREQAAIARAQQLRAERRFNDVRKLSNSLFQIHDAIANLPGTVSARKMIVSISLNYLDNLAGEAGDDVSLQRELSDAYAAIGDIQGRPGTENLGDIAGALASYQKGVQITQGLLNANPQSQRDQHDLGALYMKIGHALASTADHSGAQKYDHLALALFTELSRKDPANLHYQSLESIVDLNLGEEQDFAGDFQASLQSYSKAADAFQAMCAFYSKASEKNPADPDNRRRANVAQYNLGLTDLNLAMTWLQLGDSHKALEYGEQSLQIRKLVLARNTKNVRAQLDLADSYGTMGEIFKKGGSLSQALAAYRQTQAIAETATGADANDQRGKDVLLGAYVGLEETFFRSGQYAKALDFGHRALNVGNELTADASNAASRVQRAQAQSLLGDVYESRSHNSLGQSRIAATDLAQAQSYYQKAFDEYSALRKVGALPYVQNSDFDRLPGRIALCRSARINLSPSQPSLSKQ